MAEPDTITETLSVRDAFDMARMRHLAGALDQAHDIYQRILEVMPDHPDAVIMMASIAFRQGDERAGQTYLDRAIDLTRAATNLSVIQTSEWPLHVFEIMLLIEYIYLHYFEEKNLGIR